MKTLIALIGTFGVTLAAIKLLLPVPVPLPLPIPLPVAAAGSPEGVPSTNGRKVSLRTVISHEPLNANPAFENVVFGTQDLIPFDFGMLYVPTAVGPPFPANASGICQIGVSMPPREREGIEHFLSKNNELVAMLYPSCGAADEPPSDRALKSKSEELDSANAKLDAAKTTIATLTEHLDAAQHGAMDVHDEENASLKRRVTELEARNRQADEDAQKYDQEYNDLYQRGVKLNKELVAKSGTYDNVDGAALEAKATGKQVLAIVTEANCRPCVIFEKNVLPDPSCQAKVRERFVLALIDADTDPGDSQRFAITACPTAVVFNPVTNKYRSFVAPGDPAAFLAKLSSF